jgi:hypothetical protein
VSELDDASPYTDEELAKIRAWKHVVRRFLATLALTRDEALAKGASEKPFNAAEAQKRARELRWSMNGRRFRHYKGGLYEVVNVAVDEASGEVVVIYRSEAKAYIWMRTAQNFLEEVEPGKRRFTQIEGEE